MTKAEALELVRALVMATNRHDTPAMMAFYDPDAVAVSPQFAELEGRAAIADSWDALFRTLPDCRIEVSDVLVDDDRIAILGTVVATNLAGWFGLPPTGGPIRYRVNILCTMAGGLIAREERIYDSAGLLERLEKARLDKELNTAAEVQRALLSRTAFVGAHCEAVGSLLPCRAIGGDFFEFLELPDGAVGIALGDVSGKGAPAALLAALLQGMFASETRAGDGPAATLARINRRIAARHLGSRFATIAYGVLSPDGRFVYANAGHNPPALVARGRITRLTEGGPILGVFPDARFDEATLRLDDGDTLVMFTDGVTEARNGADEEFGEVRLMASARASASAPPLAVLDRLFGEVRDFCRGANQADDITMTVTRFRTGPPDTLHSP